VSFLRWPKAVKLLAGPGTASKDADAPRFMGSFCLLPATHCGHELSANPFGARAFWTAATESAKLPLLGWDAWGDGKLRSLERGRCQSGDFADSVTALQNLAAESAVQEKGPTLVSFKVPHQ